MDWLQFLASIVQALAWPATILILVLTLRAPVTRVLLTLTRLKYKDLELDFGRELRQLEAQAKAIDVKPQAPKLQGPARKDSAELLDEATRLAEDFPEPAIAVAWQALEEVISRTMARLGIPASPKNTVVRNAGLLMREKVIDEGTYELIRRMGQLRNMAVHPSNAPIRISFNEAMEFLALVRGIMAKLEQASRP